MKLLIDTNIFIPLEPTDETDLASGNPLAFKFASRAQEVGGTIYVHPASAHDIDRDTNERRHLLRRSTFQKYAPLPAPPEVSSSAASVLGTPEALSNDWVDNQLLAALLANAVDWLVTEDTGIHGKARRLGLSERVFRVAEALDALEDLFGRPAPPPSVTATVAHAINRQDPILDSLRLDYPGFDKWFDTCCREHREAWLIDVGQQHAAFCIVNEEKKERHLPGKTLKICTFKVSEQHGGFRFGELLLKAVFEFALKRRFDGIFVTVLEKYSHLIRFFAAFGFERLSEEVKDGEVVLGRPLQPPAGAEDQLDPADFHRRYGPHAVKLANTTTFVVPIQPRYHGLLFPEVERQLPLMPGSLPAGNAIRKAYLCRAQTRQISPGDNLLFYRSQGLGNVTVLGVVERVLVSSDPTVVASHVGKRTVYSYDDIRSMCAQGEVLAILFRQARILAPPIDFDDVVRELDREGAAAIHRSTFTEHGNMARDTHKSIVLLSIKPKFAHAIMAGAKRVEFRKVRWLSDIELAVVYATSPVQKLLGYFEVTFVDQASPADLWSKYSAVGGISEGEYRQNYSGTVHAVAIGIGKVHRLRREQPLESLGRHTTPPQSFQYFSREAVDRLRV